MAAKQLFLFGTLRYDALRDLVAGTRVEGRPAHLDGARCDVAMGGDWPVLQDDPTTRANGLLIEVGQEVLGRLDYYEAVFGYQRTPVEVMTSGGVVPAEVWRPAHADTGSGTPWDPDLWAGQWGAMTLGAAKDIMRRMGRQEPSAVGRLSGIIRARADAVERSRAWRRPSNLGGQLGPDDVQVLDRRHPYDGFFAIEEVDARHRRFDGGEQPLVSRAVFRVADAATVLPYDPFRDRVLFIEQLRFGPLAQSDPSPWLLEPVAGLIDAGETPEDAARRETAEEAGLALNDLHFVARYYPSPGGVAQVLFTYVGIADLPDEAAGLGGHEDEGEDILGHVVSFEAAENLMQEGDIVNAPAIIAMQWLKAHREELRAAAGAS